MKNGKPAVSDSSVYKHTFYGILNAEGDFWTPLAFPSSREAEDWRDRFWELDPSKREQVRQTHKIVPVEVLLTEIVPASAIEARSDETQSGSAVGESAVPQGDAQ